VYETDEISGLGVTENCFEREFSYKSSEGEGPFQGRHRYRSMVIMEPISHSIPLEIYLSSTLIRGALFTRHNRVSNHLNLRSGDESLLINNAIIEDLGGNRVPSDPKEYLLYLEDVLFIADLSTAIDTTRVGVDQEPIRKDPRSVLVYVSPYWIRGTAHLIPGAALSDLLVVKKRFIPITEAKLLNQPDMASRTLLVNGTKISCLAADDASKN